MSDKPKPWPYLAAEARDRAAEAAIEAERVLEPLIEIESDPEKLRRITRTLIILTKIARLLEGAGANTRP
jgi:hypothetical protein